LNRATDEQLRTILTMKSGFRTLRQVDESSRFLLMRDEEIEYDADAIDKVLKKGDGQGLAILRDIRDLLEKVTDWTTHSLESAVNQSCQERSLGLGKVAQPIRVAVSGGTISPPIFQSLEFLGKTSTLARISRCLQVV
jgi:glutamyl-tRNA synthetase